MADLIERHESQLWARLDQLYANGTTFISWGEIYHWYGLKRIAKTPWRDIKRRWEQILMERGEKYTDPLVAETLGGVSLFFSTKPGKLSALAT